MTDRLSDAAPPGRPAPGGLPPQMAAAAAEMTADLPRRAADTVQLVVDTIHDRAIRPAILAARAVVFGLIVAALSMLVLVLGSIALVRLLDVYAFGERVWLSYLVLGAVLSAAGLLAWSQRTAQPAAAGGD